MFGELPPAPPIREQLQRLYARHLVLCSELADPDARRGAIELLAEISAEIGRGMREPIAASTPPCNAQGPKAPHPAEPDAMPRGGGVGVAPSTRCARCGAVLFGDTTRERAGRCPYCGCSVVERRR